MSSKQLPIIIGENIVKQRKKIGLSQKELANKLGISYEAMSRIENGKSSPKIARMQELASYLECPVSSLFADNSDISNTSQERALLLEELISPLSEESQEALIEVLHTTIKAIKKG